MLAVEFLTAAQALETQAEVMGLDPVGPDDYVDGEGSEGLEAPEPAADPESAEPEAVAVLIPGREQAEYILFCRERDPKKEQWDGPMAGQEGAVDIYGADDAFPIADLDEGIRRSNDVDFGLHAAVFTSSLNAAFKAVEGLEAGSVIVNDSTDYRLDSMPFGGIKKSGLGREGIRFSLQEMTEPKVVCWYLGGS